MPDQNMDIRLRAVENSLERVENNLAAMVTIQQELKDLSKSLLDLLHNNRYAGERLGSLTQHAERQDAFIKELQIQFARLDIQVSGVWKIVGFANALALVIIGWFMNNKL